MQLENSVVTVSDTADVAVKNTYRFSLKELEDRVKLFKKDKKQGFVRFYINGREYTSLCENEASPQEGYDDYVVVAQNRPKYEIEKRFTKMEETENELKILSGCGVHPSYFQKNN